MISISRISQVKQQIQRSPWISKMFQWIVLWRRMYLKLWALRETLIGLGSTLMKQRSSGYSLTVQTACSSSFTTMLTSSQVRTHTSWFKLLRVQWTLRQWNWLVTSSWRRKKCKELQKMRGEGLMLTGDTIWLRKMIRGQEVSASAALRILSTWAWIIGRSVQPKFLRPEEE